MTRFDQPIPFANDVEKIPLDEESDIQKIVLALDQILARTQATTGQYQGEVHVKTHGYAEAEFRVLPNLPPELAQGLFARSQVYSAVVRFSNSAPQIQSDAIPDGRGLAIKVRGVDGDWIIGDESRERTQDFLGINHPVFFAATVKDYLQLQETLAHAESNPLLKFAGFFTQGDWNPLHWNWNEVITASRIVGKVPRNPNCTTYFSMSPFRFGQYVAKYRIAPAGSHNESFLNLLLSLGTNVDALRLAIVETLRTQGILFEFQVQLRNSESTMPVEDPTVEWPEGISPYQTVAHLFLPRQEMDMLRLKQEYQSLSFNVWHALEAHRPLGGINRVRRPVYAVSSAWRARGERS